MSATFQGVPCKRGHSGLRYKSGHTCVECARIRKRDHRKIYLDSKERVHTLNVTFDLMQFEEVRDAAKKANTPMAAFIREAVEWRMMELGE